MSQSRLVSAPIGFALGIDVGAVSVSAVLLRDGEVLNQRWLPHHGEITNTLRVLLDDFPSADGGRVGFTGSHVSSFYSGEALDELVCAMEGIRFHAPMARSALVVGGERSGYIELDSRGRYLRHATNGSCACGTGLFLQQQAERLGLSLEELADAALRHEGTPPFIATRCAVFGRTDVIHLLQSGNSVEAVCAGLCHSLARGLVETLVGGEEPGEPLVLAGGVALIAPVREAIEVVLGQTLMSLSRPEILGATGAALLGQQRDFDLTFAETTAARSTARRPHLVVTGDPKMDDSHRWTVGTTEVTVYRRSDGPLALGIDVGARSTKAILVDRDERPVAGFYTWTSGRPLEATQEIFRALVELERFEERAVDIIAVGTTGSGRKLVSRAFGADCNINEITAHAAGALHLDPEVDTIFEIGGQDSKLTRLSDGLVTLANMNYACAAGTGIFIEEQARKLGVTLGDYAELAVGVEAPMTSERCTLFMERDIGRLHVEGHTTPALLAAVLHSVCDNYFNKVVGAASIGDRIVMQGATALNAALVAAFEARIGKTIKVSPFCHLAGALGAALVARRAQRGPTKFRGLHVVDVEYATGQEVCELCSNRCRLTTLSTEGTTTGSGMRCGREYRDRRPKKGPRSPLEKLDRLRLGGWEPRRPARPSRGRVGLPQGVHLVEHYDQWALFLSSLGFEVLTTEVSNDTLALGRRLTGAMTCSPAALLLGQAQELCDRGCDLLFLPTFVRGSEVPPNADVRVSEQRTDAYYCFLTQYLPAIFRLRGQHGEAKLISPLLSLNATDADIAVLLHRAISEHLSITLKEVRRAWMLARDFHRSNVRALKIAGSKTLERARTQDDLVVALLGVPYATRQITHGIDLDRVLSDLGVPCLWTEMIPKSPPRFDHLPDQGTHWHYGKQVLRAAHWVAQQPSVYPIFVSSVGCGPGALLIPRFQSMMERADQPFLVLQLDPQASDAGLETRLEAAIDTFKQHHRQSGGVLRGLSGPRHTPVLAKMSRGRTFYVPQIDELICRLWKAAFIGEGYDVRFFDQSPADVSRGQCLTGGGECLAIPSIIGGAVRALEQGGAHDPAVFVPTSAYACAYPEFAASIRRGLDLAGFDDVPVYAPNLFALFPGASLKANANIWESVVASDLLRRALSERRPAEKTRGDTDAVIDDALRRSERSLLQGKKLQPVVMDALRELARVPVDDRVRPRVLLVGNLFLRFNAQLTDDLIRRIEQLGGGVISPPTSDYTLTARYQNRRLLDQRGMPRRQRIANTLFLRPLEEAVARYERGALKLGIFDERAPFSELEHHVIDVLGVPWALGGETLSVLGRVLQTIDRGQVEAVVHVNSLFCQPAYVSEVLMSKVLKDAEIPFINLYLDGSGVAQSVIEPLMRLR